MKNRIGALMMFTFLLPIASTFGQVLPVNPPIFVSLGNGAPERIERINGSTLTTIYAGSDAEFFESMVLGPDGKLYACDIFNRIARMNQPSALSV